MTAADALPTMACLRKLRDERGFTIIEVMVAALILVVGILGVTTIVNASNATTTSNKAREQGLSLARELVESARSVPYQSLLPSTVVSALQGMPGFANAGAGPGWTIRRRGIVYTVAVGVCSVDDAGDTTGAHPANLFCARPTVQATADRCRALIGTPPSINGTGVAPGLDGGDCGLDTNLDGQVDNLLQTAASDCPVGTSVSADTCDAQPDDFKRLVVLVTWDRGAGSRYVLQQATVPFPGLSAYGAITSLTLHDTKYTLGANGYVVADKPTSLAFDATSSQPATRVDWLLGGVDQGQANWSGTSGSFTWDLGNNAPDSETSPATGEVLDGSYLVGARVQDAGGIHGTELDVAVTLNRRIPFPPTGFSLVGLALDAQGNPTQVQANWSAPPDHDVVDYVLYRQSAGSTTWTAVPGCTAVAGTTCTDTAPPSATSVTYKVVAQDHDPATGALRDGQSSATQSIRTANQPPTAPTNLTVKVTGGGSGAKTIALNWTASTDPDDAIQTYRIYVNGTAVGTSNGTNTTYTDTESKSATYTYQVSAIDSNSLEGPKSAAVSVTI